MQLQDMLLWKGAKNPSMYIKVYFPSSVHLKLRNEGVKCKVIDLNDLQIHENKNNTVNRKRKKH